MPVAVVVIVTVVKIAVMVVVPAMVVVDAAPLTRPIAGEESLAVMMRRDPMCSLIRRPRPVTLVPFIVISYRIPVAPHPDKLRRRLRWQRVNHARWWRRSDQHSNRHLRPGSPGAAQNCRGN